VGCPEAADNRGVRELRSLQLEAWKALQSPFQQIIQREEKRKYRSRKDSWQGLAGFLFKLMERD
jgi:hypothetical protein